MDWQYKKGNLLIIDVDNINFSENEEDLGDHNRKN